MTKTKSGAKKLGAMKKGCENSQFSQVVKFRNFRRLRNFAICTLRFFFFRKQNNFFYFFVFIFRKTIFFIYRKNFFFDIYIYIYIYIKEFFFQHKRQNCYSANATVPCQIDMPYTHYSVVAKFFHRLRNFLGSFL